MWVDYRGSLSTVYIISGVPLAFFGTQKTKQSFCRHIDSGIHIKSCQLNMFT